MTATAEQSAPPAEEVSRETSAPAPPTREEMRDRVRAALAEGRTTIEEVVADMYASLYWTECQITSIVQAFATSRMGRKMIARAERDAAKEAGDARTDQ